MCPLSRSYRICIHNIVSANRCQIHTSIVPQSSLSSQSLFSQPLAYGFESGCVSVGSSSPSSAGAVACGVTAVTGDGTEAAGFAAESTWEYNICNQTVLVKIISNDLVICEF